VVYVVLLFSIVAIVGVAQNYTNDIKIRKMSTVKRFEDLEVWKLARELCNEIFLLTDQTAFSRDFSLRNQINGSSGSEMDKIAKGFEQDGSREFIQFLSISKGSCGESRSQLYRALGCKYLPIDKLELLSQKTIDLGRKISNLMIYLRNSEIKGNKYKTVAQQQKQKEQ